jgi:hypothetical protein
MSTTVDPKEVPQNDPTKRAGYDYDPYSAPCQLADIHSANIPFHDYRQIHVSEVAFYAGFRAKTAADLPVCPPLWQDVQHYWDASALAGFELATNQNTVTAWFKSEFTLPSGAPDLKSIALKGGIGVVGGGILWQYIVPAILHLIGIS